MALLVEVQYRFCTGRPNHGLIPPRYPPFGTDNVWRIRRAVVNFVDPGRLPLFGSEPDQSSGFTTSTT